MDINNKIYAPFGTLWALEFWERFGYYGLQAIIAIFFVKQLNFHPAQSMMVFASFSALLYAGPLIGGWIGDNYLGAKRTIMIGGIIICLSYLSLSLSAKISGFLGITEQSMIFYALAGVAVGGGLFKANPASLISKLFKKNDPALDGAMTFYYMAINLGSCFSILITPWVALHYGYLHAFIISAVGMFIGIMIYIGFYPYMAHIHTKAGAEKIIWRRVFVVVLGAIIAVLIFGNILLHTTVANVLVLIVGLLAFIYFFIQVSKQDRKQQKRMMVAFILILQGILFFVLYQQMPTSLNFFALNNVNPEFLGMRIVPEQWQILNPLFIVIMSPILSILYKKMPGTHVTKFCIGMSLCSFAFLVLYVPQFTTKTGVVSGWWLVLTYSLQSTGELFISALGLSMVAELFPRTMSGFALGMWALTTMIASPIAGWVGALTAPNAGSHYTKLESIAVYGDVFLKIGLFVLVVSVIMWLSRRWLNSVLDS